MSRFLRDGAIVALMREQHERISVISNNLSSSYCRNDEYSTIFFNIVLQVVKILLSYEIKQTFAIESSIVRDALHLDADNTTAQTSDNARNAEVISNWISTADPLLIQNHHDNEPSNETSLSTTIEPQLDLTGENSPS